MTSEELDEGRDVILENDDYIFMEILNSQTAKYYGPDYIAKNWGGGVSKLITGELI